MKRTRQVPGQLDFLQSLFASDTPVIQSGVVVKIEKLRFNRARNQLLDSLYKSGLFNVPDKEQ